jgi:TRAP transporter 4TM/12TM fusion protein
MAFRYVFWFALGLSAASFGKWGIVPVMGVIGLLVVINFVLKDGKETLRIMKTALVDGAKQALGVGIACAIVGVIIGVLTLTGAASNFAGFILEVGEKSLFLSLLLTMVVCLVLGMGIPTIPNYIITSSIAAPALLKLGVPLIVSHMFVFYFGIMADLTPPVALAAFAAASIAKAPAMKIGFKATQIAIAGFVIPFMAVYDPALMVQGDPTVMAVVYVVFKALLAIFLWGAASIGYLWTPVSMPERIFAALSACFLVVALPMTDQIGFATSALFIGWNWYKSHKK